MPESFDSFGLMLTYHSPAVMAQSHRHSEIELNLIETGTVVYLFGGNRYVFQAGQLVAFWGAMPHQLVEASDPVRYYCVTVPLALLLRWELPRLFMQRLLDGLLVLSPEDDTRLEQMLFRRWFHDLQRPTTDYEPLVLLELQACLGRLALGALSEAQTVGAPAGKAERMAQFIARHYDQDLTIEQIARAVNLHPNYAMSLFRKTYQVSLLDYLTQHRLAHAQRLLATTSATIVEVALEAGFTSVSRFYDVFRAICGRSPGEYRKVLGADLHRRTQPEMNAVLRAYRPDDG